MTTTYENILTEHNMMKVIKYALALVIIAMGAYGYDRFFNGANSSEPVWFVVILFIVIEGAMLMMTTISFSSTVQQTKKISFALSLAILTMWLVSAVGIDQTIWGMVESKYHKVKLSETSILAEQETENLLKKRIVKLHKEQTRLKDETVSLEDSKLKSQKAYDKNARQVKDIIYYNGKRCDTSIDCSARRVVGENALNIAKQNLDAYILNIKMTQENIAENNQKIIKARDKVEEIVAKRVEFEKQNRVVLNNKKEEALVHVKLMNFLNNVLGLNIETPERAYVLLLSFIIYPIYILFVAFMSSNSPERKKIRQRELSEKLKRDIEASKLRRSKNTVYKALMLIAKYVRKSIGYLIATRRRKVITKEIEIEVEVIKEVEKIVYKDGREIVEIEIEVPHIIEKKIVIEKIVKVPVIEKEFVTVPADTNLNELNKLTGHGSIPKDLQDVLRKINEGMEELKMQGVNNDQYRTA